MQEKCKCKGVRHALCILVKDDGLGVACDERQQSLQTQRIDQLVSHEPAHVLRCIITSTRHTRTAV